MYNMYVCMYVCMYIRMNVCTVWHEIFASFNFFAIFSTIRKKLFPAKIYSTTEIIKIAI